MTDKLQSALDLMRRLPPNEVPKNLERLVSLVPDLEEDLVCSVDQPLKTMNDPVQGRDFLICDYNRDQGSFRSPWSNKYFPTDTGSDAPFPSPALREFEKAANDAFDTYRELYYEGGLSSVYAWDVDRGFAACILLRREGDGKGSTGAWDSIHVVQVQQSETGSQGPRTHAKYIYTLTSTILLSLGTKSQTVGDFNLCGSMTRRAEKDAEAADFNAHLANIGRMVEDMENKMRTTINDIYFSKTQEVLGYMHRTAAASAMAGILDRQRALHQSMAAASRKE